jgi:uridine kinase
VTKLSAAMIWMMCSTAMPTYEKYIKPFKNEADLIVPNNSSFDMALDVVRTYLRAKSGK